jgi:two-component system NtrC family response regulator
MPGTVLFVDDEIEMCFMVSNLLKQYGYNVYTAENADVALNLADAGKFSAMILDVNLAGEDGFKLMTFLHRNNPGVPIIIYTGSYHDDETIQKALKEGATKYLCKGGPTDELIETLRSVAP